ncbi:MAG: ParB/RepB/Spo0J family partition protein [Hyphomicrobiales bacterium]|nr:ParB/RepB/Spo0J family partition protein [Hyphomicrobiales bacterium]
MPAPENPIFLVPLSKLLHSPHNVRRTGKADGIAELAASIAAHGLLQNLTVAAVADDSGKPTGKYAVVAGARRLAALQLLAKQKRILKSYPVPCALATVDPEEVSLAENVAQVPMHPADQYEAFARLHAKGMAAEDIAARFGVTPAVVERRLRLAAVSPALLQAYRDGELTLEQLMAFTITDDHALQERVFAELTWNKTVAFIKRMLTETHVAADDRRVRYVGLAAYEAAGGMTIRDLFSEDGDCWLTDRELLDHLVREKLEADAAAIKAEGWAWVIAEPEFSYSMAAGMRRIYARTPALTPEEQATLDRLRAEYEALCEGHESAEELDAETLEQLEKLEDALDRVHGEAVFDPADIARCGAFVSLGHDGTVKVERGFLRPEDEPPAKALATDIPVRRGETGVEEDGDDLGSKPLSDRLLCELAAARTQGLQAKLAANQQMALIAIAHALVSQSFYHGRAVSALDIGLRAAPLHGLVGRETVAGRELEALREEQTARLPQDAGELWAYLAGLPQDDLLKLLAAAVAPAVNALREAHGSGEGRGDALAQALDLDMAAYWAATADGYFSRLSKAHILAAVREGVSEDAARRIEGLKRPRWPRRRKDCWRAEAGCQRR